MQQVAVPQTRPVKYIFICRAAIQFFYSLHKIASKYAASACDCVCEREGNRVGIAQDFSVLSKECVFFILNIPVLRNISKLSKFDTGSK